MKWDKGRRSNNVEDRRGTSTGGRRSLGGKGTLSLGGIAIIVLVGWLMGESPMQILNQIIGQSEMSAQSPQSSQPSAPPRDDEHSREQVDFVKTILGDTEDTWKQLLQQRGVQYTDPKLVLFSGGVNSGCGFASTATGPFYCPADRQVYLDLSFFDEMKQQFSASGDFANAYVIAHEIGHHVQNELGISRKIQQLAQQGEPMKGATGLSVRQELQADCFAGVWANHAQQRHHWLEDGDVESALNAANAIGDDRLQQQAQGRAVPDSFTHGTSQQRVNWFTRGLKSGDIDQCDTLSAQTL
ncbi:KPN_02809 family neutral zinc metallopeptidase [Carnimonas nigrificans]|uniref:KPN_02809 family neutral zinc metallopeptidase n=1 Tax=Carnimonas nigrificans TaxID=64323 RepID=UPI0004701392|nr:neutral zinc metallopeptidase [Carnimonas nigrificans]